MSEMSDSRQEQYIEWLITPKRQRKPKTQAEVATMLDVDDRTLRRWQNEPEFRQAVNEQAAALVESQDAGEIYAALAKQAKKGSVAAIRTYLEMTGKLKPEKGSGDTTVVVNFNRRPAGSGNSGVTVKGAGSDGDGN